MLSSTPGRMVQRATLSTNQSVNTKRCATPHRRRISHLQPFARPHAHARSAACKLPARQALSVLPALNGANLPQTHAHTAPALHRHTHARPSLSFSSQNASLSPPPHFTPTPRSGCLSSCCLPATLPRHCSCALDAVSSPAPLASSGRRVASPCGMMLRVAGSMGEARCRVGDSRRIIGAASR